MYTEYVYQNATIVILRWNSFAMNQLNKANIAGPSYVNSRRKGKLKCYVGLPLQYSCNNKKVTLLCMKNHKICLAFPVFSLFSSSSVDVVSTWCLDINDIYCTYS